MKTLKIKLSYRRYSDRAIAMSLLNEFKPIDKLMEKSPSIDELLNFTKDSYNFCLNQARKWQKMITRHKDYIWELVETNFNEENVKDIVFDHDHFKVYFYEDIEFDETLESYERNDTMFYHVFGPYLQSWSTVHNGYRYETGYDSVQELINNLEVEFEEI